MPHHVTIDTNFCIFQYQILNNVLYLNEKLLNFHFVIQKMKPLYAFFTLAIKQNLSGLNYNSY